MPPFRVIAFVNGVEFVAIAVSGSFKKAPLSTRTKLALVSADRPGTKVPEEIIAVPVKVLAPSKTHTPVPVPFFMIDKVPPLGSANIDVKVAAYNTELVRVKVGDVPKATKLPGLLKII